jgi:uncharacterized protein
MFKPHPSPVGRSFVAITGAAGGLGKAFAVECASRGWNLLLTDLAPQPLETLAAGLRSSYGVRIITHTCDLTDPVSRTALYGRIHQEGLRFWGLLNVAGIDHEGLFLDQSIHQIRAIIRLNIEGTLDMTHALLDFRDSLNTFRIVNVASLAAFSPMPVKATYAASKRFLLDFSLALREEVRDQNATVTVLCPAGMPTNAECIQGIEAQGWIGQVTTCDVGRVANETINAVLAGRAVVIPGLVNRVLQRAGGMLPSSLLARLIGSRWKAARQKRGLVHSVEAV